MCRDFFQALPVYMDILDCFRVLLGLVFRIYLGVFVWHCGSRTAGEVLFCYSPKEYPEKAATSAVPLEKQGFPLMQYCYHAAPELVHVEKHVYSDSWHRKPMITAPPQWLAEVGKSQQHTLKTKSKAQPVVRIGAVLISEFWCCLYLFAFLVSCVCWIAGCCL